MANEQVEFSEEEMKTYRVQGFSCANCAAKFESHVKELPGVIDAKVNFGAAKIYVQGNTTIDELEKRFGISNINKVTSSQAEQIIDFFRKTMDWAERKATSAQ